MGAISTLSSSSCIGMELDTEGVKFGGRGDRMGAISTLSSSSCIGMELDTEGVKFGGRGDRIRTCDPLLPKQMRYRTAPLPVDCTPSIGADSSYTFKIQ